MNDCVRLAANSNCNFALKIMLCDATGAVSSTAEEQTKNSQAINYPNIMQGHIQGPIFGILFVVFVLLTPELKALLK